MMGYVFAGMIAISVVVGLFTGKIDAVGQAAVGECVNAVQLFLTLMAGICLWSGIMKIAKEAKITDKLAKVMAPLLGFIFHEVKKDAQAISLITMNIVANLLGLGNAATPFGIAAMKRLEEHSNDKQTATDSMVTFVVLNSVSIQIIPTTVALLRLKSGSISPFEIMPAVWVASVVSLTVGVIMSKLPWGKRRR